MEKQSDLVGIAKLSQRLRLPVRWLKQEARSGRLPCLRVGRRMLFSANAVEDALAKRARKAKYDG